MNYPRFEKLVLAVGAVAIIAPVVSSLQEAPVFEEIVAQLLLLAILVGAVHWGRKGGFVSALGGVLVYLLMRLPQSMELGITSPSVLQMIALRSAAFGLVGIVGGEFCGRLKYLFARMEDARNIDPDSRIYNERYMSRLIASAVGQHRRYGSPFAVVVITLAAGLTGDLKPGKRRALVRATANHLRNDVRMVDEVGRLDDGRFVVLLPQTPLVGARVAAERLRDGVRDLLGARDESVSADVMGAPEDLEGIQALNAGMLGDVADVA